MKFSDISGVFVSHYLFSIEMIRAFVSSSLDVINLEKLQSPLAADIGHLILYVNIYKITQKCIIAAHML